MPLPDKKPDEDKQKFVSRCMSDPKIKKEYPDSKQRVAVCMNQARGEDSSLVNMVHDIILAANQQWDDEWEEFVYEVTASEVYDEEGNALGSEYQGRKVQLNKPFRTPDGPKKFSVYVKNEKGNVVKVNFGDPNMKIKKNIPERRKSFRARHNCDNPGPKWKARYWSCKAW
jgi:hypothetical protein